MMAGYVDYGRVDVGDRMRFRATFRNPDTLEFRNPDVVTAHVWRVGDPDPPMHPTVTQTSTGTYECFFTPEIPGDYLIELRGTGNWGATLKGTFHADGSQMPIE